MNLFDVSDYLIRRRFLTILGKYDIYNSDGASIGYCKHKAFQTKDSLHVFESSKLQNELLSIQSRNIINTVYDVVTPADGKHWGVCNRNLVDMLHAWQIQSDSGIEMELMEESPTLAFLPRFITNHVHHTYRLMQKDELIAEFCLQGHPFVFKLNVHLVSQKARSISPLILASAILISDISHRYR